MEPQAFARDDDTAVPVGRPERATLLVAPSRPTFNLGLLAALVACVAFWVLVALTVDSLM